MKTIILILTLSPALLFAQSDSVKKFHITKPSYICYAMVVDSAGGIDSTVELSELMKGAEVELFGCGDSVVVTSFTLDIESKEGIRTIYIPGAKFPADLLDFIEQQSERYTPGSGPSIRIRKFTYKTKDKKTHSMEGGEEYIKVER